MKVGKFKKNYAKFINLTQASKKTFSLQHFILFLLLSFNVLKFNW